MSWPMKIELLRATARHGGPRGANNVRRGRLRYKTRKLRSCMQPIAAQYWEVYLHWALMESDAVDRPDLFTITLTGSGAGTLVNSIGSSPLGGSSTRCAEL